MNKEIKFVLKFDCLKCSTGWCSWCYMKGGLLQETATDAADNCHPVTVALLFAEISAR